MVSEILKDLKDIASREKAKTLSRYFKTGDGEYGEGDIFLGLTVPEVRKIAKRYSSISFSKVSKLINSDVHEVRLLALEILVFKYESKDSTEKLKKEVIEFFLKNISRVNNWDLVDLAAPYLLGDWLLDKDRRILYDLAKSKNLWEKRISIVSTAAFIRKSDFNETFEIAKILLNDKHDLIHKAVGWMLREVGKKDLKAEENFLLEGSRYKKMPRTMLRYAIERFEETKRKRYLKGEF